MIFFLLITINNTSLSEVNTIHLLSETLSVYTSNDLVMYMHFVCTLCALCVTVSHTLENLKDAMARGGSVRVHTNIDLGSTLHQL